MKCDKVQVGGVAFASKIVNKSSARVYVSGASQMTATVNVYR